MSTPIFLFPSSFFFFLIIHWVQYCCSYDLSLLGLLLEFVVPARGHHSRKLTPHPQFHVKGFQLLLCIKLTLVSLFFFSTTQQEKEQLEDSTVPKDVLSQMTVPVSSPATAKPSRADTASPCNSNISAPAAVNLQVIWIVHMRKKIQCGRQENLFFSDQARWLSVSKCAWCHAAPSLTSGAHLVVDNQLQQAAVVLWPPCAHHGTSLSTHSQTHTINKM